MSKTKGIDIDDLLNDIVDENEKHVEEATSTGVKKDPRILNFKKGHTYRVRLLIDRKNPRKTFVPYSKCGFKFDGGRFVYLGRSPKDAGIQDDPINELQWETFSKGDSEGNKSLKEASYKLFPKRQELVNVYVVEDSSNSENEGTVMVMDYPAQIDKEKKPSSKIYALIQDGAFGTKKAKVGKKLFSLGDEGICLKIVTKDKSGYMNYDDSEIDFAGDSELGLSDEGLEVFYNSTHNLEEFVPEVLPMDKLKNLLATEFSAKVGDVSSSDDSDFAMDDDDMDDIINDASDDADNVDLTPPAKAEPQKKATQKKADKKKEEPKEEPDFSFDDDGDDSW